MDGDTLKTILILAALGVGGYFIYQRFFIKRKVETATAPYYPPTPGSNVVLLAPTSPPTSEQPITSILLSSPADTLKIVPPPSYTFYETVITTPSGAGVVTL